MRHGRVVGRLLRHVGVYTQLHMHAHSETCASGFRGSHVVLNHMPSKLPVSFISPYTGQALTSGARMRNTACTGWWRRTATSRCSSTGELRS